MKKLMNTLLLDFENNIEEYGKLQEHYEKLGGYTTEEKIKKAQEKLTLNIHRLNLLSPKATLKRGYAIVRRAADGVVLRRADTVRVGDPVDVLLSQGGLRCEVKAMDAAGWNAAAPSDPTE